MEKAKYLKGYEKIREVNRQLRAKSGPYYERWKCGLFLWEQNREKMEKLRQKHASH